MTKNVKGHFKYFHPFGCPVYVLDENLQSGKKLPTWNSRARVGIYLGQSREHASNVSYVLNTRTDHISPQYHVIYDDDFATLSAQTELQEVNLWKGLDKTQPKLGLVNQLPNQDKINFEEQSPMLNVMDLHNAASTGLVNPDFFRRNLDNPRAHKNRKSTKMSNPQSRATEVFKLKDKKYKHSRYIRSMSSAGPCYRNSICQLFVK